MKVWLKTRIIFICLELVQLSSALLDPAPFPDALKQCYEFRSFNMTPSDEVAVNIQNYCYRQYQYKQIADGKIWSPLNITKEGVNYIHGLFRQIFNEARDVARHSMKSRRHKRQARFPGRYRQEVRSPGGAFRRYARCILRLQREAVEPPQSGRNTYQTLAVLHSGQVLATAHGGPAFIPWHRIYLLLLETACGTPIPYWDSTVDHDMMDPTRSMIWSDMFFGNGDGEVMTGPFQSLRTILGDSIIRNIGTGDSSLFTKEGLAAVLSRRRYEEIVEPKQGAEYVFSLEGHHNGPHVWVGGHLSLTNTAAYDPIFFNHHAFIDHVYEIFRQQQLRSGINPIMDYPTMTPPGHAANDLIDFRPYAQPLRNIEGLSRFIANLVRYEPLPTCQNRCNRSPHLFCDQVRFVCVSRARPTSMMPAGGGFGMASQPGQAPASQDVPTESRVRAQARGPIPGGARFRSSPFTDSRNRPDTIGSVPASPQLLAASVQARAGTTRRRRDVSQKHQNNTSLDDSLRTVSALQRSFTNTFMIDGVVDLKRWVYVPVRVFYNRSLNIDGNDPTLHPNIALKALQSSCHGVNSGAFKVFVTSNGLNYVGTYKEFVILDERQPFSVMDTAIGIKNPDYGGGEVLFTAYDSCGRPCRALCTKSLEGKTVYKSCSAVFKVSAALPKMFRLSYRDALSSNWKISNLINSQDVDLIPPITFVCDNTQLWPWDY
ncbi:tyrosinase-like protein 1 [Saccostrea echinata]|uniref:tyrosinase-like protein 1 n=1 Tax=Saccostrea echinata TaxID=191078 RepID=UPI002A823DE9|nr:tyrosinase-like protein 1 [Saccostrea echinata]